MLKEIYIDNFKCLTNFKIQLGEFQLWMGDNGTGKSTVFDALRCMQLLLKGKHIEDVFDVTSLTVWDMRDEQRFKIEMEIDGEIYNYELVIHNSRQKRKMRIEREELKWKGSTFYLFDGQDAHLYRINWNSNKLEEGASFPADWGRSHISTIARREDNWPLINFREAIYNWLLINPVPMMVNHVIESESRYLSRFAENFGEWYRYVLQDKPRIGYIQKEYLEDILPGFEHISLNEVGQSRRLTATFRIRNQDEEFEFMALSDGQRQLIMLYTILEALRAGVFTTLFIDEPDNYISLREIQPWLENIQDICEEEEKQVIIISHHPEIINKMARGEELLFSRQEGEHVIVKTMPKVADLPPAEIVARGWEDE